MRILIKIIFVITLLELFLGGGGRVFEIGIATFRMVLFFLNILVVSILYVYRGRIPKYVPLISISIAAILIFYSILGLVNGAELSLIAEDVKPLSYFFSIIFFSYFIDSEERVKLVITLIKGSSLFMAISYILIQILIFFGYIDFLSFYQYANTQISSSDFIFRGTSGLFFYKGFTYMVVGLMFWLHASESKWKGFAVITIMAAMILTGTRGFIVMFGLLYGLFYGIPLLLRLNVKILVLAAFLVLGSLYFFANFEIGDKNLSDSIRIEQIIQVVGQINPLSLFIGHGFGIGVAIRPVHMEIGYLEIFHKQGLLGLSLWVIFFLTLYNAYVKCKNFMHIRKAFLLGASFFILLSFTNPFFNNPIGISMFMITLACLSVFNNLDCKEKDIQSSKIKP